MCLNRCLHYIQLINKNTFCNKNVVLCVRDMLYLHTQLCISSDSSGVNAVAAAAAVFIVIIIGSHSNTYVLFQV